MTDCPVSSAMSTKSSSAMSTDPEAGTEQTEESDGKVNQSCSDGPVKETDVDCPEDADTSLGNQQCFRQKLCR